VDADPRLSSRVSGCRARATTFKPTSSERCKILRRQIKSRWASALLHQKLLVSSVLPQSPSFVETDPFLRAVFSRPIKNGLKLVQHSDTASLDV
jgi:hypothetical protein